MIYVRAPDEQLTQEQERVASDLRKFGLEPDQAEKMALWNDLGRIRGALAKARRTGKGIGWLIRCIKEGWDVDGVSNDQNRLSRRPIRKMFKWQSGAFRRADGTFETSQWGTEGVHWVWAPEEEEAMYEAIKPAELRKKPHEFDFNRPSGDE